MIPKVVAALQPPQTEWEHFVLELLKAWEPSFSLCSHWNENSELLTRNMAFRKYESDYNIQMLCARDFNELIEPHICVASSLIVMATLTMVQFSLELGVFEVIFESWNMWRSGHFYQSPKTLALYSLPSYGHLVEPVLSILPGFC